MLNADFYGKQGFIWFSGIVEDVRDPAQLGQVRVRIIGLHSEDKSLAPTETLPWAQVVMPATGAKTHSGPIVGDWVLGYFQDGHFAQIPVIFGVFPGVEGRQSRIINKYQEEQIGSDKVPKSTQHHREEGEGTTFRSVRGVLEGTLTQVNNTLLSTTCGISPQVWTAVFWSRLQSSIIVKELVLAIKALAAALGSDPTGLVSFAISVLKHIKQFVDWIRDILEVIKDWVDTVAKVVAICRSIVDYILSLPARLKAFLQNCLNYFLGGIANFLSGILGQIGDAIFSEFPTELIDTINDVTDSVNGLINTTNEIAGGITGIANDIDGITEDLAMAPEMLENTLSPNSIESQMNSTIYLDTYIKKVANNSENLVATTVYTEYKYATP